MHGDLDRRKHDVDILERVLGGIRDSGEPDGDSRVVDVDVPGAGGSPHSTLELTVGIDENESPTRRPEVGAADPSRKAPSPSPRSWIGCGLHVHNTGCSFD